MTNYTCELVPYNYVQDLVASKCLYRIKYKLDGSIEWYKASLVATGNHQQAGIDFHETFSPTVRLATIRLVLCIALSKKWSIHQLDVKNAFVHGIITKQLYMRHHLSFIDPQFPKHVCHLKKAIYGLKQSSQAWFHRFGSFRLTRGFHCS